MAIQAKIGNKYEWIKGDNFGKEDVVKNPKLRVGQMNFIEFVSGRRCSVAIANEYLNLIASAEELEIDNPEEFVEELAEREGSPIVDAPIKNGRSVIKPVKSESLYKDILDKIKSFEDTKMDFSITVSLPKQAALKVLLDAYGEDLEKELATYVGAKLDEDIKKQISERINTWITALTLIEDENN
jgi:hypothetical protein